MCIEPVVEGEITHDRYAFAMYYYYYYYTTSLSGCSLLKVIEEFERRLSAGARSENLIKAVDSKFRKSAQEVHIKYSKVTYSSI